jgi:hypothetical protein
MRARVVFRLLAVLLAVPPIASAARAAGPAVTVYTQDLGFVRETRNLEKSGSRDTVRIPDVPVRIDFTSVRLVPSGGAKVTRLAYRFDVASGDGMIEGAVGRRVRVTSRGDRQAEGTLVAADGSWLVLRADDRAVVTLSRAAVEEVRLADPPATLSLRPTLEAVVEGGRSGRIDAELSYLTGGLSWNAEHVVTRKGERGAVWSAAVTVENTTGRDFVDADLKLVAGDVGRVMPPRPVPMYKRGEVLSMAAEAGAADLSEQTFSEYHLYTLGRPATLRDRESQSLSMIEPRDVRITPRYLYRSVDPRGVTSQIEVMNTKDAGLGVPLPAGRVRFYETDAAGTLQFTGEARIAHTAEGEKATLDVGRAFDLAAERREVSSRRISDREREVSVEIKLRNRKKSDVAIVVQESLGGDVEMIRQSHPFTRKDAGTLEATVPVAAGKEVVVTYTARLRY